MQFARNVPRDWNPTASFVLIPETNSPVLVEHKITLDGGAAIAGKALTITIVATVKARVTIEMMRLIGATSLCGARLVGPAAIIANPDSIVLC